MKSVPARFLSLFLSLMVLPLLAGCWSFTVHSYPDDKKEVSIGRFAALATFADDGKATHENQQQWLYLDRIYTATYSLNLLFAVRFPDDEAVACRYARTPEPEIRRELAMMLLIMPYSGIRHLYVRCEGDDDAIPVGWGDEKYADAWASLARYRPLSAVEFDAIVETARTQRADLSEVVRAYKVRAEAAVREQKYWEAADFLDQALTQYPAWSQGHYNLSLICEELGLYDVAIDEMQKYLKLVPKSENLRAIQDKIYLWQGKLKTL